MASPALNNAKPVLEVKSRRVGGATYQVPIEVRPERRQALAMRWLIQYARARGESRSCGRVSQAGRSTMRRSRVARTSISMPSTPNTATAPAGKDFCAELLDREKAAAE